MRDHYLGRKNSVVTSWMQLVASAPHDQKKSIGRYANELKASHEAWTDQFAQKRPWADPVQLASEALELATRELEEHLRSDSPKSEEDGFSLDDAMSFLRRHTPTA